MNGQIVPRGPDAWLVRVYLGMGPTGRRQYVSKTIRGTKAEARKALTAMLAGRDSKTLVPRSTVTLSTYLEGWLAGKIDVAPRTRVSYGQQLQRFLPQLGGVRLDQLKAASIQAVLSGMQAAGLGWRTIEYAKAVLHAALEDAVRADVLPRNPARHTKIPPRQKRPPTVLGKSQLHELLERTKGTPMHPLWTLLLTSGLRPQEALALRWLDLDEDSGALAIHRTLVNDGHGKYSVAESTKTDGSARNVALPRSTVATLRTLRECRGEAPHSAALVFQNAVGRPLDLSAVRRHWKAALKASGLPEIRLYDTRHTHLTALLTSGVDIAMIAARAGHKDISVTVRHYAHVMPEAHRSMADLMERILTEGK